MSGEKSSRKIKDATGEISKDTLINSIQNGTRRRQGETSHQDEGYAWVILFACTYIGFLKGLRVNIAVYLPVFFEQFNLSWTETTSISAIVAVICEIMTLPFTAVLSMLECRTCIILGCFISSLSLFLFALFPSMTSLYVLYGGTTAIGYLFYSVSSIIPVQQFFKRKRTLAGAIIMSGVGLGSALSNPLTIVTLRYFGWRGSILIYAAFQAQGIVCGFLVRPFIPSDSKSSKFKKARYKFSSLSRDFLVLCVSFSLVMIGLNMVVIFTFMRAKMLGLLDGQSAMLSATVGLSVPVRILFGWIGDLHCVNRTFLFNSCCLCVGISIGLITLTTSFQSMLTVQIVFAIFQAGIMALYPAIVVDYNGMKQLRLANSIIISTMGIATLLISTVTGPLVDAFDTLNYPFLISAMAVILGSLILFVMFFMKRRKIVKHYQETSIQTECKT